MATKKTKKPATKKGKGMPTNEELQAQIDTLNEQVAAIQAQLAAAVSMLTLYGIVPIEPPPVIA
jgi:hypothetical protein